MIIVGKDLEGDAEKIQLSIIINPTLISAVFSLLRTSKSMRVPSGGRKEKKTGVGQSITF